MFKSIRDEALGALAEPDTNKSRNGRVKEEWRPASGDRQRSDESEEVQRRLDLVGESRLHIGLVRRSLCQKSRPHTI